MKRLMILLTMISMFVSVALVNAQDVLEPGATLEGEISDASFETEYTFSGTADTVIIVEMLPVEDFGDLTSPQLILIDSSGSVVVDTIDNFDYAEAILVTQLPEDGDYTLIATREDGRSGDSVGEYTITLLIPEVLEVGGKVSGFASSEGRPQYFVVNSEDDFVLRYSKNAGDFNPEVAVGILNDSMSGTDEFASAYGQLDNIAMGNIEAGLYIVQIQEALFDFNFDEVTADFNLSVESAE